jgi:hypothetical protein
MHVPARRQIVLDLVMDVPLQKEEVDNGRVHSECPESATKVSVNFP